MSVYYNESEIPGIAQDIVDREYGGDWGEIKRDMESNDIYLADEKLVYTIQDYMGSFLDVEDEDDDVELLEDLLFYIEDRAKTSRRANRKTADEFHNGWTNYETWYIKAIIDNDYDLYKKSRSRSVYSVERIIELVRFHPLNELSDSDMQKVNWSEILKDLVRERNELNGYTSRRANRRADLKVSYSKEDEFEVHDEVVEKFPGGEGALADLFGYTNLDQAEINSAKVMPYIEDAVFSRGGDQDDVDFAYDNLEYYFQTEY